MALTQTTNQLLRQLPAHLRERLSPHFTHVPMKLRQPIYDVDAEIGRLHFVESGVISMVTDLEDGGTIETATIGNEGFSGLPFLLGRSRSANRVFVQVAGESHVVDAAVLEAHVPRTDPWFALLMRYGHYLSVMMGQNAACNSAHNVEQRMCRWLLMCHDRVTHDHFMLTQQFLAEMLGVTRASVNVCAATLQRAGFVGYTRGQVTILDRQGLEASACECYRVLRLAYDSAVEPVEEYSAAMSAS